MLNLYRRIRRNLLDEGRLRKYLVYAIGEILLVMIGILLALQVNNWNEGRKAIWQGEQYTREIYRDLQIDVQNITMIINLLQAQYESAVMILKVIESLGSVPVDSIQTFQALIDLPVTVNVERKQNTWDNLKSTGKLDQIREDSLNELLVEYYDIYDFNVEHFNQVPFEARKQLRAYLGQTNNSEDIKILYEKKDWTIYSSHSGDRLREWLNDKELPKLVSKIGASSAINIHFFINQKEQAQSIIDYIEKEHVDILIMD